MNRNSLRLRLVAGGIAAIILALALAGLGLTLLFERHVGPDSHDLPPDNVQTVPHLMVAQRTSPTNIGLYLLAAACAERFGWIGTAELVQRLERTLATLARLPRHRGHLLNWIDVQTLQPLLLVASTGYRAMVRYILRTLLLTC